MNNEESIYRGNDWFERKYFYKNNQIKNKKEIFMEELGKLSKEKIIELIKLTILCHSYEETIESFKKLYEKYPKHNYLSIEIIELLHSAFKSIIYKKQEQIEKLSNLEGFSLNIKKQNKNKTFTNSCDNDYLINGIEFEKEYIKENIKKYSLEVLNIIDKYIIFNLNNPDTGNDRETETLIYKMKGDINKYLSQITIDKSKSKSYLEDSKENYQIGYSIAEKYLNSTNKTFLEITLSFIKLLVFFRKEIDEANELLKYLLSKKNIQEYKEDQTESCCLQLINNLKEIYKNIN